MKERLIKFDKVKAYLSFSVHFDKGSNEMVHLEVGCAEDIENMMKLFADEQWEELFPDEYDPFEFMYAVFTGVEFHNSDEKGNKSQAGIHGVHSFASSTIDLTTLQDKNAEKLQKIRAIVDEVE